MSYINRKLARQTGTNRTTQAEISNCFWLSFAGRVNHTSLSHSAWYRICRALQSREVAPLGIKVTIVEPGGFRTDFAGSSTELSEGHPAYDTTVGATARFQRNYSGKQPGDPKKAAQAILHLTQERNPPLRLLLGSDAYAAVEKNDLARLEEARIWKELSVSTDFETE